VIGAKMQDLRLGVFQDMKHLIGGESRIARLTADLRDRLIGVDVGAAVLAAQKNALQRAALGDAAGLVSADRLSDRTEWPYPPNACAI
jgi:hypothetical protein